MLELTVGYTGGSAKLRVSFASTFQRGMHAAKQVGAVRGFQFFIGAKLSGTAPHPMYHQRRDSSC